MAAARRPRACRNSIAPDVPLPFSWLASISQSWMRCAFGWYCSSRWAMPGTPGSVSQARWQRRPPPSAYSTMLLNGSPVSDGPIRSSCRSRGGRRIASPAFTRRLVCGKSKCVQPVRWMNSSAARWKCPAPCATQAFGAETGGRGHSPVSSRCRKSESSSRIERASSSVGGESAVEGAGLQSIPVVVV